MEGQDSLVVLLFYMLAFLNLKRGREFLAGFLLAGALVKFQVVLPLVLIFAFRKRSRFVSGVAAGGIALGLVSVALVGFGGILRYIRLVLDMDGAQGLKVFHVFPSVMPNLRGISYFLLSGKVPAEAISIGVGVASGALIWWVSRKCDCSPESDNFDLCFSLAVLVTVMVSYHLNLHDASLLLLPAFLVLNHARRFAPFPSPRWLVLATPLVLF
jgi:glycosyl transferase family 87